MILTACEKSALNCIKDKVKKYSDQQDINLFTLQESLNLIPIMKKNNLIEYGLENNERYLRKGILFSETSGTTGEPLLTPRGQNDLNWNTNNQMLAYKRHIQSMTDRVAIVHPGILSPFVEASALALKNLGVGFLRIFPIPKICDYKRILNVIQRNNITTIMTTPSLAYKILYEVYKINHGFKNFPAKKFLLTGEHISKSNANNLNRLVGKDTYTVPFVYGSSEVATVMYGVNDCSYRAIKEDFIFELIDINTNKHITLHKGEKSCTGQLIITWLREGLLPIVRYDTNDTFQVDFDHQEEIWHFLGRQLQNKNPKVDENIIDAIIYNEPFPIFHFTCDVTPDTIKIVIITIPDLEDIKNKEKKIKEKIASSLNNEFNIFVNINPENHFFYDFSPSPKMSKFNYII